MWVIALSYTEAVRKWRELIAEENGCAEADVAGPTGIQHICDDDEFIAITKKGKTYELLPCPKRLFKRLLGA